MRGEMENQFEKEHSKTIYHYHNLIFFSVSRNSRFSKH